MCGLSKKLIALKDPGDALTKDAIRIYLMCVSHVPEQYLYPGTLEDVNHKRTTYDPDVSSFGNLTIRILQSF